MNKATIRGVSAVVQDWDRENGTGTLVSEQTPGRILAHWSDILGDQGTYKELPSGQKVVCDLSPYEFDGFQFRASKIAQA